MCVCVHTVLRWSGIARKQSRHPGLRRVKLGRRKEGGGKGNPISLASFALAHLSTLSSSYLIAPGAKVSIFLFPSIHFFPCRFRGEVFGEFSLPCLQVKQTFKKKKEALAHSSFTPSILGRKMAIFLFHVVQSSSDNCSWFMWTSTRVHSSAPTRPTHSTWKF